MIKQTKEPLSLFLVKTILIVSAIVSLGALAGSIGYLVTKPKIIIPSPSLLVNKIEISADQKSILNAETKEAIFTIADTQKYLKDSGYFYSPDTFQTTNAKYEGDCFLSAVLSNNKDRIVFSTGCLPGDLPQAWVGVYKFAFTNKDITDTFCSSLNSKGFGLISTVSACIGQPDLHPFFYFLINASGRNFVWSQDDKTIAYEADLGLSGMTETRMIDSATGRILYKKNSSNSSRKIYNNRRLGFELTFPDISWFLPSSDETDPHFYASEACANSERSNCFALEIQNHDSDSEFLKGSETMFNILKVNGRNPIKLPSLIAEAIVIKSNAPGPAEGWSYEYDVFFKDKKRAFLIFTNTEELEKDIISTFKAAKKYEIADWKTYKNEKYGFEFKYPEEQVFDLPFKGYDEYPKISFSEFNNGCYLVVFKTDRNSTINPFDESDIPVKQIQYAFTKKLDSGYAFYHVGMAVVSHAVNTDECNPMFNQILSTFKFIKPEK